MFSKKSIDFEISFFENLVEQNPDFVDALIPLAEAYTKKGLHAKGLEIDKRLSKLLKTDPIIFYNLACSYALVGRKREAFTTLLKAVKLGYSDFNHLKKDRDLRILHDDPRFKKLISIAF